MRTITAAQEAVLSSGHRSVHARVSFKPSGGSFVDITDYEGYNWLVGFEYGGQIDSYVHDAIISLHPGRGKLRLAPLMDNSKLNANGAVVDAGNEVKIEVALVAPSAKPSSSDWFEVFLGEVENVSWESAPIKVSCLDQGTRLVSRFIESETVYPNDSNTELEVETIMQQILDDVFGASVVTLYSENGTGGTPWNTSDSPGWIVKQWIQQKQSVQQALLTLVNQIGWQFGYRWQENTDSFELMMYAPGKAVRARGTVTHSANEVAASGVKVTVNGVDYTEGTDWDVGDTLLETAQNIASAISATSGVTAWALGAEQAIGTMTFTGQPTAAQTFTIGSTTFTEGTDWDVGSSLTGTLESITVAINASSEPVTSAIRGSDSVKVYYDTAGTGGNSVTFSESLDNCTFDGSGTLGGSQAGKDVRTVIEWDAPGTAGNSITLTETLANGVADAATLGTTKAGTDVSVARTFTPSQYHAIKAMSVDRADVRNSVKVAWGADADNQSSVTVIDQDSIDKYGKRPCEIALGASDQIDTESESRDFALSIIDALKDADIVHNVEMPYFPFVQLSDYYTFAANGVHYDTDQSIAVNGYRHSVDVGGNARTVLRCQGKPRGGHKRWLRLESRPGVGDQNSDFTSDAPVVLSITADVTSLEIVIKDPSEVRPRFKNWAKTRLYLSTTQGFVPSGSDIKTQVGRQTKINAIGLIPGQTYYVRVSFLDNDGNESAYSPELSAVAQKVAAYHADTDERMWQNRNPSFDSRTYDDQMPDAWELIVGTLGSTVWVDETDSRSGTNSLVMAAPPNSQTVINGQYMPVTQWQAVAADVVFKYTGTPAAFSTLTFISRDYDRDKATLSGGADIGLEFDLSTLTAGKWYRYTSRGHMTDPDIAFIRPSMGQFTFSGSSNLEVYVDTFSMTLIRSGYEMPFDASVTVPTSTWTRMQKTTAIEEFGVEYIPSGGFPAPPGAAADSVEMKQTGRIHANAGVYFSGLTSATEIAVRFIHMDSTGTLIRYHTSPVSGINAAGDGRASHSAVISVSEGDYLGCEVYQNEGTTQSITAGDGVSFASVRFIDNY